jgi:membrane protein YqaA with SNARE-associated domain
MAQVYFKRGEKWGHHWTYDELTADNRTNALIGDLVNREGVTFVAARSRDDGVVFVGRKGSLTARRQGGSIEIAVEGQCPLDVHPVGQLTSDELFHRTYDDTYPDAVNQLFLLFSASRSGDIAISSEPGYDLRLQYEDPEHHGSHGSLHKEHMHVPLIVSVPLEEEHVSNCDLVPTVLDLCGKKQTRTTDGRALTVKSGGATAEVGAESEAEAEKNGIAPLLITLAIIFCGLVLTVVFKEDILSIGEMLMTRYGQEWVDGILFLLTAVSSSPLALPIWAYALVGVSLGYSVIRLAIVMAFGSATGSVITFAIGKYFGDSGWLKRKFPDVRKHPWTYGKSRFYVTLMLFLGTASPVPCDVLYVACGVKGYPTFLFWVTMVAARFVRYIYMGYIFKYAPWLLSWFV